MELSEYNSKQINKEKEYEIMFDMTFSQWY